MTDRIQPDDPGFSEEQEEIDWRFASLVAVATVAAIGNGSAFRKAREFAAWLGLVPRQHSTGGKASSTASANAAMCTCAACPFMALALCCCE